MLVDTSQAESCRLEDSLMESGEEEEEDDLPEEEPPSVRPRDYPSIDSVIPDTQIMTPAAEAVNALRESPSDSTAVDHQALNGGTGALRFVYEIANLLLKLHTL